MVKNKDIKVGILMPDGSVADPGMELKCQRCGCKLPWSRLDEISWCAQEIGVVCVSCEADIWKNY